MTRCGGALCIVLAVAAIVGCDDGRSAEVGADSSAARRLDGVWTIQLDVDRLRLEPVAGSKGQRRSVRGEIALVSNHWLAGGDDLPRPTQYGTYDIDFSTMGFDPRHGGQLPRAAARMRDRDSVELVLEPDDPHESLHLQGTWRGDSIAGRWSLEPVRAGGDAAGTFSMTRHGRP